MEKDKYYLEVWVLAQPFTNKFMRMAGINLHQKNMFMSLCKMFVEGFGTVWDKQELEQNYKDNKQTIIKFWGTKAYLDKQLITIKKDLFKTVMEDQYRTIRDKVRRLTPRRLRKTDEELKLFSNYDKFVSSLAYFNITLMLEIKKKDGKRVL